MFHLFVTTLNNYVYLELSRTHCFCQCTVLCFCFKFKDNISTNQYLLRITKYLLKIAYMIGLKTITLCKTNQII